MIGFIRQRPLVSNLFRKALYQHSERSWSRGGGFGWNTLRMTSPATGDYSRLVHGDVNRNGRGGMTPPTSKISFKDMAAEYGPVFVAYWSSLWVLFGGGIYVGIESFGHDSVLQLARQAGLGNLINLDNVDPALGSIAATIVINEALEIVRLPLAIATTPALARLVQRVTGKSPTGRPSRLKTMIKEHGPFFLGYWTGAWILSGILVYAGITVAGPDAAFDALRYVNFDKLVDLNSLNPKTGNIAMAILVNEALEPIRFPLTVATLTTAKKILGFSKK